MFILDWLSSVHLALPTHGAFIPEILASHIENDFFCSEAVTRLFVASQRAGREVSGSGSRRALRSARATSITIAAVLVLTCLINFSRTSCLPLRCSPAS